MIWLLPYQPPPPLSSASCLFSSVFLRVADQANWRGGGVMGEEQIIQPRESLARYKLFNTLLSGVIRVRETEEQAELEFLKNLWGLGTE